MKYHFYLLLIFVLLGCENNYEDSYRYSKIISQSKDYSVYLDMSEIGNIQVTARLPQGSLFKIVSNDKYYFVGDMLNGIYVYEKKEESVSYLCFIECRYIKDFDLTDNQLFCNNFADLVVLDVSNPLQINILHRQKNHFNRFTSYKDYWNVPYVEGKGLIVGSETHVLTGTVTDKKPNLDFTKYDSLYGNLMTKVLPDSWFSNHPEIDKPYIGIIKIGTDQIYTYGTYNSWAICTFLSGTFNVREEYVWTTPRGKYAPPYYYSDAWPVRMFFSDSLIYILGSGNNSGYSDCITSNEPYFLTFHLYFPTFKPLDITYLPDLREFLVLSGQSIWGAFKYTDDQTSVYMEKYIDYKIQTVATSILRIENNVITLGDELSVYLPSEDELKLVKTYPDISGTCWSKEGDVLAVANIQGLFLYDISDLENIKLIP
ncbi:MAG: hypothetical protein K0B37_17055 [Bacteroidales bacterium]|nr:hypothetical protein [Bacteroidales bacterium]